MVEIPVTHGHSGGCPCWVCSANPLAIYQSFKYMVEHLGDPEQSKRYRIIEQLFPLPVE